MTKILVLVTGTGRSGTSAMAGSLHQLGLYVPGPFLGANQSNPKGFYESKWAVRFHKRITRAARIHEFDSRPATALARVHEVVTPQMRQELVDFLAGHAASHDQIVVKDPRSAWVQSLWKQAAHEVGLEIRYLSMLRHPAEVVGSRSTYYAGQSSENARRRYETFNVARWVNGSLVSEHETRGEVRSFVLYPELLEDWRSVLRKVRDELGLHLDADLDADAPHALDEFLEPALRRHKVTWVDLEIPSQLEEVAEAVWQDLLVLEANAGHDEAASADLDVWAGRYATLFFESDAISHDATEEAREMARAAGFEEGRRSVAEDRQTPDRLLRDAGGRELLRALAARTQARMRR